MQSRELKILIAEDDEDDVILISGFIREGFPSAAPEFDCAHSSAGVLSCLERNEYDFCLLDFRLGETNGLELLRNVRQKGYTLPIIFLTGRGDEETAAEVMKSGAADYLSKTSLSANNLAHAIHQAFRVHEGEERRHKPEDALAQDKLLQAILDATNYLLTSGNHKEAMDKSLDVLGNALEVDSVEIYQHSNGSRNFIRRFAWLAGGGSEPNGGLESFFQNQTIADFQMEDGLASLKENKLVQIRISGLPSADTAPKRGICPLSLVPIMVDDVFWGCLAFGDSRDERRWSKNEESLLKTMAANIGGEIRRHNHETALYSIIEGTSSRVGDDFFRSLVRRLASALSVGKVYVSEMLGRDASECSVLAGWEDGQFLGERMINMKNTPLEEVLAGMVSYHPDIPEKNFNGHSTFGKENIRSCAAVPCFDSHCKIIGHLSVMDSKPLLDRKRILSILKIFAARAGAEIERKRTESLIRDMAYHDSLTGLPNRVLLNDRLEMALAQAQRSQGMLAVLFMDFDHFKRINDNLGHDVGDQVLKEIGARLKNCLRNQDTVARLGGDEFILLLPEINSPADANNLAKKLLQAVSQPIHIEERILTITISIGVCVYPQHGKNSAILLKHADEALYQAKKRGKNCYRVFEFMETGVEE